MSVDFTRLAEPFKPEEIEWRIGSTNREKTKGLALAYMDARAVMERLDTVCGPENWQCRYTHANAKTVCEIGIRCGDEWIWKADGAGDTQHEAEKGALSDAFKRAAFRWGIGRYLYDLPTKWVPISARGNSYVFADGVIEGLRNSLRTNQKRENPIPSGELSKTALRDKVTAILHDLYDDAICSDLDTYAGIIADNQAVLEQCQRDLPTAYYGKPDDPDFVSVQRRLEDRRKQLAEKVTPEAAYGAG